MRYVTELIRENDEVGGCNSTRCEVSLHEDCLGTKERYNVNIMALGDVGSTLLLGLKLLGANIISEIGIWDISDDVIGRFEMEMNQIADGERNFPKVRAIDENELFSCDVFLFCASAGVPKVGSEKVDVRMIQLEKNRKIVEAYAQKALHKNFKGMFAVVSDPVDQLCKAALEAGINCNQIRGFGLGVMNGRAEYFAQKYEKFSGYIQNGRVFGPHGKDLIVAENIENYDESISEELTSRVVNANLEMRALGFKPYIAPAISSGAISVIDCLRGKWHYSSLYFGKAFLGIRNKREYGMNKIENLPLDKRLYEKIEAAISNLERF